MGLLVNQLSGFGILTFAKESRAVIDAMTVPPNAARKRLIDLTVRAFLGAALWPLMDVAWFLAAHDEQAGRLNWKDPGNFTLTAVNSPTFTADRGFAGNGSTSYLDTGWDAATNAVQFTRDNAHIAAYARDQAGSNVAQFGIRTSFNTSIVARIGTAGRGRANAGSDVSASAGGAAPLQIMVRRSGASATSILRDGVEVGTGTQASTALSSVDFAFGLVGSNYSAAQVAAGTVGANLSDPEALAHYQICNAYMRAIGADT